jgi:hypothetical protein
MSQTGSKTGGRSVKAVVKSGEGKTLKNLAFGVPAAPGAGRAARWMREHLPVQTVIDAAQAVLKSGHTLTVTGCAVMDLYSEPTTDGAKPEPEPDLDTLDLEALRAYAVKKGVEFKKQWNAQKLRKVLRGE